MKRFWRALRLSACTAVILLAAAHVVAQDVRYNFDRSSDFTRFKTYKWVSLKNAEPVNNLTDKQIKEAVDAELAQKGLTKVDGDSADPYIGYHAAINQEEQFTSFSNDWGYGPGWYRGGWYGGGTTTTTGQTSTIYVGQLALDMYDSANHDLVWRGVVSKTLNMKAKPEKQQKELQKSVAKLLKEYPPEVKK